MNSLATRTQPETPQVRPRTTRDGTFAKRKKLNGRMTGLVMQSVAIAKIFAMWVVNVTAQTAQQYRKVLHKKAELC
jgi:hypothetical protein